MEVYDACEAPIGVEQKYTGGVVHRVVAALLIDAALGCAKICGRLSDLVSRTRQPHDAWIEVADVAG